MKQQKLLSLIRQAIQDYNMIEDGDRIAVGVSGGKDSLTLVRKKSRSVLQTKRQIVVRSGCRLRTGHPRVMFLTHLYLR